MAAEVDNLRYEPQIGSAAPVEVGFEIRVGNAAKRATMKLSPGADPCDQAAGEPLDLQGVVSGRLPNEIGGGALETCEAAVKSYPDIARFRYELGRALLAAGRIDEARQAIQEAADKGHIRALFALGSIASSGTGTAVDASKANGLYSKASDNGDPYALAAWGRALFNGIGVERDTGKGLDLLLQAAAMGHVDAMKELAVIFTEGRNGVPADPARALAFLKAGMERQDVYSMGVLGLSAHPARTTPVVMACKAPKVITKIKVVRVPVSKPKTVTPTIPGAPKVKPMPTGTGRTSWTGGSSRAASTGGGNTGDGEGDGGDTGSDGL
ncbi:tetratricopeptide repeat protein [Mesorhizobium sp. B2-8-5]|uniref:tetratricopeptide repeat protein n=1 Tax=Mesorhizobium sp. B2-8-5 TaxID=2589903 RepID=UPI001D0150F6|nr:tetratricopeptide repeat protein [Mesorhizobium sp. B2-8-5]UCI27261.1 sel1 repeat family protein [Mesorhizobium sp. B2-8-5]